MQKLKNSFKNKLRLLLGKNVLWGNSKFQQQLSEYFSTKDFQQEFLYLVSKLSNEDINQLTLIIGRLQKMYKEKINYTLELTDEEITRLRYLHNVFENSSVKLNDNQWYYDGFLYFAKPQEVTVFVDHCGIRNFTDLYKIRQGDIIDVGASFGDSSVMLSKYTDHKVHAFEIETINFKKLEKTITANNLEEKIIPINKGLSSLNKTWGVNSQKSGSHLIDGNKEKSNSFCETTTLDHYVLEKGINIGLIKVDVEGHEMQFLKGATEVIKTQKPSMIISIYHSAEDFFGVKPFIEQLVPEYHFKIFKSKDYTIAHEIYLLCEYNPK